MFSRFFIDRPIFAWVLSIIVTFAGGIAVFALPIAQYPEITPPTVEVSAVYPGANAKVVADTVAAPIEQQVNGVEGMMYMSSQCTNDGAYALTVTFQLGTNLNMAQILVQNRVSMAQPILPDLVQRRGVAVKKKSPSVLMIVNLFATDDLSADESKEKIDKLYLYLSNYATIQLRDELARLPGVGDISYLGQRDYSMRIWLNPSKMSYRGLSANDVISTIQQQNLQVAAGRFGQPPVPRGQEFEYTISTLGRLTDEQQFGDMVLKTDSAGRIVHMKDVAEIQLGAQSYDQTCTLNTRPSVALSVYQLPGSNALDTAKAVRAKMKELRARFPAGIDYSIVYDTTPFIKESINDVFKTLRDAVILVAIVVLFFLQDWRAMILPMIDVPVSLIGTFAVMAAMGFTLNNLTLFGLVLAIGIVVDDAIVVLENIERLIGTGLDVRSATIKAMDEITGPIIAITLVLCSVFLPSVFIAGITGQFYRQFALTISVAMIISAGNAMTLTPSRAVVIFQTEQGSHGHHLKREAVPWWIFCILGGLLTGWLLPQHCAGQFGLPEMAIDEAGGEGSTWMNWVIYAGYFAPGAIGGAVFGWFAIGVVNLVLGWIFTGFNRLFDQATVLYGRLVAKLLRVSVIVLAVYGGLLFMTYWGMTNAPVGFIPQQDQGYLLVNMQLPDASSLERTEEVMRRAELIAKNTKGVKHTVAIAGQSLLLGANAPNFGSMYVMLDDFDDRTTEDLSGDSIRARLQSALQREIKNGIVNIFGAPPVGGLGTAGGFKMVLEDRTDLGVDVLQDVTANIVENGREFPEVEGLFTSFRANTPWIYLDIDRQQAKTLGVPISELFNVLQIYLGSLYVNDFNRFGRTWQVNVQASETYRAQLKDLARIQIRNTEGAMVPLVGLIKVRDVAGPIMIARYNLYSCAAINGNAAPGVSSGDAISAMEAVARKEMPSSMHFEWTELALLQLQTGNTGMLVFVLAVLLVFLVLAAQYESWSLPLAVILVVPMCLLCSVAGVVLAKMDVNIFTQIGFVVLIGLACKNAILVVEFAKVKQEEGMSRFQATLEASRLRLRPIVMTSFAFILGVVPLVIAHGAGAEMRRTLGTAVFSGMLGVTLFGIFLTPVFYYTIQWFKELRNPAKPETDFAPLAEYHAGHLESSSSHFVK